MSNNSFLEVCITQPKRFNNKYFELPLSPLAMEDARNQLELQLDESATARVLTCRDAAISEQLEGREFNLFSLNAFVQRLMALTTDQYEDFSRLVFMEKEPVPLERINQLLFNTGEITILSEVGSYAQLGRFYYDNSFLGKDFENLPDSVAEKLDFEAIGKEMHAQDRGILRPHNNYTLLIGWPELPNKGVPLPTSAKEMPGHTIVLSIQLEDELKTWKMPCDTREIYDYYSGKYDIARIKSVDCVFPLIKRFWASDTNIETYNSFAQCLQKHQHEGTINLYKAAIDGCEVRDIEDAIALSSHLDQLQLVEAIRTPEEYARQQLEDKLPPEVFEALVDMHALGIACMDANNILYTNYGLIGRKDGAPIHGMVDFQPATPDPSMESPT